MVIRLTVTRAAAGFFLAGTGVLASGQAIAQANVLKECGTQYQAAKAANELGGQGWQDFLKSCRARLKEAAPAGEANPAEAKPVEAKPAEAAKPVEANPAEAAPAPTKPAAEAKPAEVAPVSTPPAEAPATNPLKPATDAKAPAKDTRQALQARQKKCAAEWKANKKSLLKENAKLTWPKFWSDCNKKLKEAGE